MILLITQTTFCKKKVFMYKHHFLFKSVACDNLWTIFIRWWFHPLSISVYGRHWNTWKVCKNCFEWLTLKGGVCVGLLRTDIFLVMAFTEMYLFKFPSPDLFLVVSDFFSYWFEFNRDNFIKTFRFFLELFKCSWCENMPKIKPTKKET